MNRIESLRLAFPTFSDSELQKVMDSIDSAIHERKIFCQSLLQKAERLKADLKRAQEIEAKNKKRK